MCLTESLLVLLLARTWAPQPAAVAHQSAMQPTLRLALGSHSELSSSRHVVERAVIKQVQQTPAGPSVMSTSSKLYTRDFDACVCDNAAGLAAQIVSGTLKHGLCSQ